MFQSDLNALVIPDAPTGKKLEPAPTREPIPAQRSESGEIIAASSGGAENEVFTEVEEERETVTYSVTDPSDPNISIDVEAITKLVLTEDTTGRRVEFNFVIPPESAP